MSCIDYCVMIVLSEPRVDNILRARLACEQLGMAG